MKQRRLCKALAGFIAVITAAPAWPLVIQSPSPGESVAPGQTVWLIVGVSSPAETDIQTIQISAPGANGCENVPPTVPVQCPLTIPDGSDNTAIPAAVDIRVQVIFADGSQAQAATHLRVAEFQSPQSQPLQALQGDPRISRLEFDAINEERDLPVFGLAADGATHDLRGRSRGTVYEINNPAVVAVQADGRVVSKAVGAAIITVRHGSFAFEVPVNVRDR